MNAGQETGVTAYLARLGLDERPPATVETLTAIHQRHIEQIPYENLGAVLGAAPDIDAATTLARVAAGGNAGYCFHHNGLLTLVLRELGFNVVPAWGYPWGSEEGRRDRRVEHLALTVRGLPTDENPGGIWYPDVGCGDGIHAPLPLVTGEYRQGPFTYRLEVRDGEWTFFHDPKGSYTGAEIIDEELAPGQAEASHHRLTDPDGGPYTSHLIAQHRLPDAVEALRGCVFTRKADTIDRTEVTRYDDWRDALHTVGVSFQDVDADALRGLFDRSLAAHRELQEAG
ncbi:arylamine N-acetyltransferase [Promicromonospora thailandica]|uniref:arylamine N-acetyltransferase family protein n=1 Tax=Promicromonospora thailandica TaxID=765201 RepID=UPI0020A4278B|nr:arylamine N-acetyltransferase [Promicromonospora thailandica]